jgi:hypothetical protein
MEMQTIKVNRINKNIKLGDVSYRPYTIGELPNSFGFLSSEDGEQEGVSKWFNYKGLTYLKDDRSKSQRQ